MKFSFTKGGRNLLFYKKFKEITSRILNMYIATLICKINKLPTSVIQSSQNSGKDRLIFRSNGVFFH